MRVNHCFYPSVIFLGAAPSHSFDVVGAGAAEAEVDQPWLVCRRRRRRRTTSARSSFLSVSQHRGAAMITSELSKTAKSSFDIMAPRLVVLSFLLQFTLAYRLDKPMLSYGSSSSSKTSSSSSNSIFPSPLPSSLSHLSSMSNHRGVKDMKIYYQSGVSLSFPYSIP